MQGFVIDCAQALGPVGPHLNVRIGGGAALGYMVWLPAHRTGRLENTMIGSSSMPYYLAEKYRYFFNSIACLAQNILPGTDTLLVVTC